MSLFTKTVEAHRAHRAYRAFLKYESNRNGGCQMLTDAVAFFNNPREATIALRQILECNQTPEQNHAAANELSQYADQQERDAATSVQSHATPRHTSPVSGQTGMI